MIWRRTGAVSRGKAVAAGKRAEILVDDEQRRHLVEACAFFRAARFRVPEPGRYREQDLKAAAAEIDAAIHPKSRRTKKR